MSLVPDPPQPFAGRVERLAAGSLLYRLHSNHRRPAEFNPGLGAATRFAFFGDPPVPVLYAASTEAAVVCETLLHDVPASGGQIRPRDYSGRVISRLLLRRACTVVAFHSLGLRQLGIEPRQLTDTESSHYGRTVRWAAAAHRHTDDDGASAGAVWMSRRCNTDRAFVFFGDRVGEAEFEIDPSYGRAFDRIDDLAWLSDFCAPLNVDVVH